MSQLDYEAIDEKLLIFEPTPDEMDQLLSSMYCIFAYWVGIKHKDLPKSITMDAFKSLLSQDDIKIKRLKIMLFLLTTRVSKIDDIIKLIAIDKDWLIYRIFNKRDISYAFQLTSRQIVTGSYDQFIRHLPDYREG